MKTQINSLDTFTQAYLEAAFWTEQERLDEDQEGLTIYNLHPDSLDAIIKDCSEFQKENEELLKDLDPSQCGHDLWLTRNHHGTGFWDRSYEKSLGKKLTDAAHAYCEVSLTSENGIVYHE